MGGRLDVAVLRRHRSRTALAKERQTMKVIESGQAPLICPPDMNAFRKWNRTQKPRALIDKLMTEQEAIRRFVHDGAYIGTELYGTVRAPMSLVR
jgi:hypothetical protein